MSGGRQRNTLNVAEALALSRWLDGEDLDPPAPRWDPAAGNYTGDLAVIEYGTGWKSATERRAGIQAFRDLGFPVSRANLEQLRRHKWPKGWVLTAPAKPEPAAAAEPAKPEPMSERHQLIHLRARVERLESIVSQRGWGGEAPP